VAMRYCNAFWLAFHGRPLPVLTPQLKEG